MAPGRGDAQDIEGLLKVVDRLSYFSQLLALQSEAVENNSRSEAVGADFSCFYEGGAVGCFGLKVLAA
jgi:hypothetical protein